MLKVRAAKANISPQEPIPLAGFGAERQSPFTRIADPLEANALVIEDGETQIVLLSLDTLSVGRRIDAMARDLFGAGCVTLASHTHFAPSLDSDLPALGPVDFEYLEYVETQLIALKAQLCAAAPRPAMLALAQTSAPYAINRRRKARGVNGRVGIHMLPNPQGRRDDTAYVVSAVDAENGAILGLLWSFACHPVSFFDDSAVSSDFCGVVRNALRTRHGSGLPCVFAQGFCGDIRPPAYEMGLWTPRNILRFVVKTALQGKCFGVFSEPGWRDWSNRLATTVVEAPFTSPRNVSQVDINRAGLSLADLHRAPVPDFRKRVGLEVARIQLDEILDIFALSGEPVTGIADLLPKADRPRIAAGYMGHMFGYLPTSKILAEGGYEADGFRPGFSLPGRYRDDIDLALGELLGSLSKLD